MTDEELKKYIEEGFDYKAPKNMSTEDDGVGVTYGQGANTDDYFKESQTKQGPSVELGETQAEMIPETLDPQSEYLDLIKRYKSKMDAPKIDSELTSDDNVMNWMTGIGQAADVFNKAQGRQVQGAKYWDSKGKKTKDAKAKLEKTEDFSTMKGLADLLKGYKTGKTAKEKVYQTKSGLVKMNPETGAYEPVYMDPSVATRAKVSEASLGLRGDKFKFSKEVKGRLSDKEVSEVTSFDDGVRILDDIDILLETTDVTNDLGPYASRIEEGSKYVPLSERSEGFVKTQQLVGIQLADYIKSISGAAVSEQEAQRLLKNIPNMTDKPRAFKSKLDQLRKDLAEAKELKLKNIGIQKSGAKKFKGTEKKEKSEAPYGAEVERNGKIYKWNPTAKKYQLK